MNLYKLFSQLIKQHRVLALLVILVSILVIMGGVGLFSVSAYIIAFSGLTPSIAEIMVPVVGVRFFGLSRGLLRYVERLISHDTTFRLLSDLRNWLYEKISGTNSSEVVLLDKEDAFTRLVDDIERLQEFYLRTFNPYITAIAIGIIGTFILNRFAPLVALVFAVFYSFSVIVLPWIVHYFTQGLFEKHIHDVSQSKAMVLEIISGLSDILASSALGRWQNRLAYHWKNIYRIEKKLAFWKSLSTTLINLSMNYALLIGVCIAGALLATGQFEAVFIPVIAYAIFALFEGAQPVAVILQKIEESRISAKRIHELSKRCTAVESKQANIDLDSKVGIQFEKVTFKYDSMESLLLKDINLSLGVGKKIALVGSSGGGKSTLSYLLIGWLQPTEGRISYNKNPEDLFSVVDQNVYFFNTTIANNLRIANNHASDKELDKALSQVELQTFISELPEGINTELGEGDLKLSGGQRQRLAIARALVRNTPYLIFDEITAGLDIVTERKVMHTLHNTTIDKGLFVLTHRLINMAVYDEILVLDEGSIKERGTHEELMRKGSLYKRMYDIQSLGVVFD